MKLPVNNENYIKLKVDMVTGLGQESTRGTGDKIFSGERQGTASQFGRSGVPNHAKVLGRVGALAVGGGKL